MRMSLYRLATDWGAPFIDAYLKRRLRHGREDANRFQERLGVASRARPDGFLVWFHAASVGESLSILRLVDAIRADYPQHTILLTTGTVSSAKLLATRLPAGVIHQYIPVDRAPYVASFLDHWRPDLALWVESELWPNMLEALKKRQIPALLLNARLSDRSFRHWRLLSGWVRHLLSAFQIILAQAPLDAERYTALGAKDCRMGGNLKFASAPPPADAKELAKLKSQIGPRKMWVMASTHPGEEEIALEVHQKLKSAWPDLLTLIVPRHPTRGAEIAAQLEKEWPAADNAVHFRAIARRSQNDPLTEATKIYIADTLGEMGLFYRLAPVSCVAGSYKWGGHNPIEPAQLGSAILFGPLMTNFADMAAELLACKGAIQADDATALAAAIDRLWRHPAEWQAMTDAARAMAARKENVLNETMAVLTPFLTPKEKASAA